MKIGTHSGHFHADEALAVWMLKKLPKFHDSQVIRTRDLALLDTCDIVVDVGARYEPPKYFDHHQREFTTTFDSTRVVTKLSSAGLVYKHFGKDVLSEIISDKLSTFTVGEKPKVNDVVEGIYERVYDNFVQAIDGNDNGVNAHTEKPAYPTSAIEISSVIGTFSPTPFQDQSDETFDKQFQLASAFMGQTFESFVVSMGFGWYPSRTSVEKAFAERFEYDAGGRLLVLRNSAYWKEHLAYLEKKNNCEGSVLYVLYPTADSCRIQAVAKEKGSFESRKPLPEAWRGLRDEKLSEVAGVPGSVFVHASGFIGGNKTFEGALELAKKALGKKPLEN